MTRKKQPPEVSLVRSSAAEYLTFVAATGSNEQAVEMRYEDENIWLSQKVMETLYDVTVPAINQHLKRIFADRELAPDAVIKQLLTTAADGKTYNVKHYSLQAIIAVGFKIENERAAQFRKWATQAVKDYTIQGWVMDVDRLKSGGSVLTQEFFDRQLEKVQEIRLSSGTAKRRVRVPRKLAWSRRDAEAEILGTREREAGTLSCARTVPVRVQEGVQGLGRGDKTSSLV